MNSELEALVQEARHPATSFERLMALVKHPKVKVRRALLDNPNVCPTDEDGTLDTSLLEALAKEFPEEVAVHPLFVLHALVEPTEFMQRVVRHVVKRMKDVKLIETLFHRWGHENSLVRSAVAANPNAPVDLLLLLGNPETELWWSVRKAVAGNPSVPIHLLRTLGNEATEGEDDVRHAVACNLITPVDVLRTLGNERTETNGSVRKAVAKNPNTPKDLLRTLGNCETESSWWVREAVASNPNTPADVLRVLSNPATESKWDVQESAKEALAARGLA